MNDAAQLIVLSLEKLRHELKQLSDRQPPLTVHGALEEALSRTIEWLYSDVTSRSVPQEEEEGET